MATGNIYLCNHSIFGEAGIRLDLYLRNISWVYLFQGFNGLFPLLTWDDQYLDPDDEIMNDTQEPIIQFGEQLIDFICGPEDAENINEDSIFNGICNPNQARIAFRFFFTYTCSQLER